MKLGIVGLPNVGKSTLFNSLTKAGAESANYPFCTIDPNVGIVTVPDERLNLLADLYHSAKVTPAVIEFVDIAGLVKGAYKGEGLGNQFLANIREVDAIVHVVRCFDDTNVIHVDGSVDPARDIETINLELIFSDIEILERRIAKSSRGARNDKKLAKEVDFLQRLKAYLEEGNLAIGFELQDEDEEGWFAEYNLLTAKPVIYAANVSEDDLADDGASNEYVQAVRELAQKSGSEVFVICAQIEQE
ncbi:MAG: redox-regulated ATPase YchF, partial [Lachnospiraceae bacterium]|nr:redox-regulated ATPase YchF [Lachnospiraceae bacterium]